MIDVETRRKFPLAPGEIKENITVRGIDLETLRIVQEPKVGRAKLRITTPCEPCNRMDEIRIGLELEFGGRRALLRRVMEPGNDSPGRPNRMDRVERSGVFKQLQLIDK
jgi:MOSC domain-containing protein YiiM